MSRPTFPESFNLADYCLFDRLGARADKPAVLFGDRRYTYGEIAERARAFASFLASAGVRREERVLIVSHDTPAFAWAFFGVLHAGAVVAMGNPETPAADVEYLVGYTKCSAIVTIPRVADALRTELRARGVTVVVVPEVATGEDVEADVDVSALADLGATSMREALAHGRERLASGAPAPRPTHRDATAIWLFTSGSTGKSKAAIHAHRDFAFNIECYAKGTVGYREDDVTVSVPRLFFGYATGTNLMFPFAVGATTGLFAERPTPESMANAIRRYAPTIVTNVPTMMSKLLDHDDELVKKGAERLDMKGVRFHLSAGEALPEPLYRRFVERFGGDVFDGIGSAEMFHIYCSNRPGDVKPGSLGRVVDGYDIRILTSEADGPGAPELPRGETGVMWVRGDSAAMGYFEDRDKSFATFFGHWCRTGDLFRIDDDGYLYFSGRADDLLKVGGVWVAPVEVEEALLTHPAIAMAAVIGAAEDGLVKPKAFVVLRPERVGDTATPEARAALAAELKELVKNRLTKHKYPRWIVFADELPRNDRGKVDKKTLKELDARGETSKGH